MYFHANQSHQHFDNEEDSYAIPHTTVTGHCSKLKQLWLWWCILCFRFTDEIQNSIRTRWSKPNCNRRQLAACLQIQFYYWKYLSFILFHVTLFGAQTNEESMTFPNLQHHILSKTRSRSGVLQGIWIMRSHESMKLALVAVCPLPTFCRCGNYKQRTRSVLIVLLIVKTTTTAIMSETFSLVHKPIHNREVIYCCAIFCCRH